MIFMAEFTVPVTPQWSADFVRFFVFAVPVVIVILGVLVYLAVRLGRDRAVAYLLGAAAILIIAEPLLIWLWRSLQEVAKQ